MGGGSSVMGMVALPRHARRLCRMGGSWAPPAGAGTTCCRSSGSSNTISISTATLHGDDGPVPIRRTPKDDWAPLSKALCELRQERQYPFIADMNADFRDGYGAVPMSNWPDKRASSAICYLDADGARAART